MRVLVLAACLLSGMTAVCQNADTPKVDVFGGISFVTFNPSPLGALGVNHGAMPGWNTALAAHLNKSVALTADIAGYYRTYNVLTGTAHLASYTLLFGPTVTLPLPRRHYARPFAHALFGVEHAKSTALVNDTSTTWAMTLGAGYDIRINDTFGLRFDLGWFRRNTFGTVQDNFRFSNGLVINLPARKPRH